MFRLQTTRFYVFVAFLLGLMSGLAIALALLLPGTPTTVPQPVTPTPVVCISPLIPYGELPTGTRYSTVEDHVQQPVLVWMHSAYLKVPGKDGRLWGVLMYVRPGVPDVAKKEVLLYAPKSRYCLP